MLFANFVLNTFFSSQGVSPEVDGRITVAFLPTLNVVSGLLQDGELAHDQAVKVSFTIFSCLAQCISKTSLFIVSRLRTSSLLLRALYNFFKKLKPSYSDSTIVHKYIYKAVLWE